MGLPDMGGNAPAGAIARAVDRIVHNIGLVDREEGDGRLKMVKVDDLYGDLLVYTDHDISQMTSRSGALRHDIHYWIGKDTSQVSYTLITSNYLTFV
ncbi:hypothetical protein Tco_0232054 [Tanacetum coccineum]